MNRREMVRIIRKRCKNIDHALWSLALHADPEEEVDMKEIHVFRVEVKKLQALLRMTGTARHARRCIKIPKKLHRIYRIMGTVRNLLLQQERLRKTQDPGIENAHSGTVAFPLIYLNLLETQVWGYRILAKAMAYDKPIFGKGAGRLIDRLPAFYGKTGIKKYVARQIQHIRDLLFATKKVHPVKDPLHAIRKILKELLYTWTFTEPYIRKELPSTPTLTHEDLESLTVRLGEIQDSLIAIDLLQPAYTDKISQEMERTFLLDLRREFIVEEDRQKQELQSMLRKIFA